jgi:hypothetical protein
VLTEKRSSKRASEQVSTQEIQRQRSSAAVFVALLFLDLLQPHDPLLMLPCL